MGLFDKLMKKKDRPQTDESVIYRYDTKEPGAQGPENKGVYEKELKEHFEALFPGRNSFVQRELFSDPAAINIHVMEPTEEDPYYVVYTAGMSNLPMTLPEELENRRELQYAELFLFMPADWNPGREGQPVSEIPPEDYWPIHMLKFLARFPHEYETWLGYGHTIPNGPEYSPLSSQTQMGGVVLSQLEGHMGGFTAEDGTAINLFMMIPAYKEEIAFKLQYGMTALDKQFEEGKLPLVTDIHRPNFCEGFLPQ